jgi:hypothetical protein
VSHSIGGSKPHCGSNLLASPFQLFLIAEFGPRSVIEKFTIAIGREEMSQRSARFIAKLQLAVKVV